DAVVEVAAGRVPVTAGVSAASTAAACAYAEQAREHGAAGVMCLPPLLYRGTAAELAAHYAAVAEAAALPVMAYNNPAASGTDMTPDPSRRRCCATRSRRWARRSPHESGALLQRRRLPHGGHADPGHHRRRPGASGRDDARPQAALRGRARRPAAAADAGAARPRGDV